VNVVAILGALAEQGVTAILKADGERMLERGHAWTFVASGGPLGDKLVRIDAASVEECLAPVAARLRVMGLAVPEYQVNR
jgi:hypothetical protein